MNLKELLLQKLDRWLDNLMGDTFMVNPVCCYCSFPANGRINCMGNDNQVIDNPFCNHHLTEVYKETMNSLDMRFPTSIKGAYIIVQKWNTGDPIPAKPQTEAELIAKGIARSHDL